MERIPSGTVVILIRGGITKRLGQTIQSTSKNVSTVCKRPPQVHKSITKQAVALLACERHGLNRGGYGSK